MFDRSASASWRNAWAVLVAVLLVACDSTVEPVYDACPNIGGDQPSVPDGMMKNGAGDCVPIPVNTVSAVIEAPVEGAVFVQGRSISCKYTVTQENAPAGSMLVDSLFLDATRLVRCETLAGIGVKTPELVEGFPSAPVSALSPGEHTILLKSCNTTSKVCGTATVKFPVINWPTKIVYTWVKASYPNSGPRVFCILDDDGGAEPVCQAEESQKYWPMLTPDGTGWMYSKLDYSGLWFSNLDGSGERVVSIVYEGKAYSVESPVFSPDGKKIAFVGGPSGGYTFSAFVINADGGGLQRIWSDCFAVRPYIAWIPNSNEVVTACAVDNGDEYRRVSIENGKYTVLLVADDGHTAQDALVQDVLPDGQWVILWTNFTDQMIVLLRTDGSGVLRKIITPTPAGRPFSCEGGKRICYQHSSKLLSTNFDGGDVKTLLSLPFGWIETPRGWSK